jgi:mono/diheme cytochrome c family protein
MRAMNRTCLALLLVVTMGVAGQAEDGQRHGKALLESMCSRCHAVGKAGRSPHSLAPPFRTFGDDKLYDNDFGQRLQEGLSSLHPDMPTFHFSREDAEDVVSYLRAIQVPGGSKARGSKARH